MIFWFGLTALLVALLALDLGVLHKGARPMTASQAAVWSLVWVGTALIFNAFVYFSYEHHLFGIGTQIGHELDGATAGIEYFTAYLIEKSLSLDNVFVIAMVFTYFGVPLKEQHRVLFWGVFGALVLRAVFIVSGLALVERFAWTTVLFGLFLLFTAVKLLVDSHDNLEPDHNGLIRLIKRKLPVTETFHGSSFFVKNAEGWSATPLFLALVVIETSDLLFAVDSIPAVIAVTRDPFIAFSSNAFALLGMRSLYFVIAPLINRFRYLKLSLIFLLAFVGMKMVLAHTYPIPTLASLIFILGILGIGIAASILGASRDTIELPSPVEDQLDELLKTSLRGARVMVIGIVGTTVLLFWLALIVLPDAAIAVVPTGLFVLVSEFVWARGWLLRLRDITNPSLLDAPRPSSRGGGRGEGHLP